MGEKSLRLLTILDEIEDRSLDLNSSFLSPPYSSNLKDNKTDAINLSFELSKAKSSSSVSLDESDACSSDSSNLNISRADLPLRRGRSAALKQREGLSKLIKDNLV